MSTLLDEPTDDALRLLYAIAHGYQTVGSWPCWQWVKQQLWSQRLDAEEIWQGLPTWRHGYRSVRGGSNGQLPDNGDLIPLTVHGMEYAVSGMDRTVLPSVRLLSSGFLVAINVAIAMQRRITPSVTEPVELKVPGEDFIREVNGQAGTDLKVDQLFGVLRGEPATWRGVNMNGGNWGWDLTDVRLSRYANIRDAKDYLARLEETVGIPVATPSLGSLPPMALPDALDHLDLTWRLATGEHLVRVPRAAMAAKLTQPAVSVEEFESRCSALADLLNALNLPKPATLHNMKVKLGELLGTEAGRAEAAVDTLRSVVALRAGQQHQGADTRAEQARVALGLAPFAGDWGGAWDHLRAVTVQALDTIREEVGSLTDRLYPRGLIRLGLRSKTRYPQGGHIHMATDSPAAGESAAPPVVLEKSAHDVGHAVETTPLARVVLPGTGIRESAHDVQYSTATTPPSRVVVPNFPATHSPIEPAPLPDVNTGGNTTADQQR